MKFHQGPGVSDWENNGGIELWVYLPWIPKDAPGRKTSSHWICSYIICLKNIWERLGQLDACFTNKLLKPNCRLAWFRIAAVQNLLYQLNISWNIYMICFPARALQQNLHKQREERFLPIFQSHEYLAFKQAEGTPSWFLQPWQPRCENIWQLSTLSQEHLSASCLWHVVAIQCPTSKVAEFSELMFDPVVVFMCLALVMLFLAASLLCAQHSVHHEFTKCFSFQLVMPWRRLRLNHHLPEALTSKLSFTSLDKKEHLWLFPFLLFWKQNIYSISINFIHISYLYKDM